MTAVSREQIERWVTDALHESKADPDNIVNEWLFELLDHGPFERWTCNDDRCPARPEWDKAMAGLFDDDAAALVEEVTALARRRLVEMVEQFLTDHPDTPFRTARESAAE